MAAEFFIILKQPEVDPQTGATVERKPVPVEPVDDPANELVVDEAWLDDRNAKGIAVDRLSWLEIVDSRDDQGNPVERSFIHDNGASFKTRRVAILFEDPGADAPVEVIENDVVDEADAEEEVELEVSAPELAGLEATELPPSIASDPLPLLPEAATLEAVPVSVLTVESAPPGDPPPIIVDDLARPVLLANDAAPTADNPDNRSTVLPGTAGLVFPNLVFLPANAALFPTIPGLPAGSPPPLVYNPVPANPNDQSVGVDGQQQFVGLPGDLRFFPDATKQGLSFGSLQGRLEGGLWTVEGRYGTLTVNPSTLNPDRSPVIDPEDGTATYTLRTNPDTGELAADVQAAMLRLGQGEVLREIFEYRPNDGFLRDGTGRIVIEFRGANDSPTAGNDVPRDAGGAEIILREIAFGGDSAPVGQALAPVVRGLFANDADVEATPNPAFGGVAVNGHFQYIVFAHSSPAKFAADGSPAPGFTPEGLASDAKVLGGFAAPGGGTPLLGPDPFSPLVSGSSVVANQLVVNQFSHGLPDGARVVISGAPPVNLQGGGTANVNGTHTISVIDANRYSISIGGTPDINPGAPVALGGTAAATSLDSDLVTITLPGHGLSLGMLVDVRGVAATVNGISAGSLNGLRPVTLVVDENTVVIQAGASANAAGTFGAGVTLEPVVAQGGTSAAVERLLGNNPFQTTNGSDLVLVSVPNHGYTNEGWPAGARQIEISGAPGDTNGIAGANLNGLREVVEVVNANTLRVRAGGGDTAAASGNSGGANVTVLPDGVTVQGLYGTLLLRGDGSYTYVRTVDGMTADQFAAAVDRFTVLLQDAANARVVGGEEAGDLVFDLDNDTPADLSDDIAVGAPGAVNGNVNLAGTIALGKAALNVSAGGAPGEAPLRAIDNDTAVPVDSNPGTLLGTLTIEGKYGTLVVTKADGSYTYTLDNSKVVVEALTFDGTTRQVVTDQFEYVLHDANPFDTNAAALFDKALLTLTIEGANDAPVVGNRLHGVLTAGSTTVTGVVPERSTTARFSRAWRSASRSSAPASRPARRFSPSTRSSARSR
jgi:VCBS repeat-containing protein